MRYTFLEFCMSQESCPQDLDSPSSDIESNAFKQKCDGVNETLGFVMVGILDALCVLLRSWPLDLVAILG
jgi:hypothetical protein